MNMIALFIVCLSVSFCYTLEEKSNCDKLGILLYEDLGCKPVFKNGQQCPIKYDCDLTVKNNTCTFRGQHIPVGSRLDHNETYNSCNLGCYCGNTNKFVCAIVDCFYPDTPNCYRTFERGQCCPSGEICPDINASPVCIVDGEKLYEGQSFFPNDSCSSCICSKGYKGKNEPTFCARRNCVSQVRYGEKISNYCAPFYENTTEARCCPYIWICPSAADIPVEPNPNAAQNSDLTCKYGTITVYLGGRLETEIEKYRNVKRKVQCECILPPLLTCRPI